MWTPYEPVQLGNGRKTHRSRNTLCLQHLITLPHEHLFVILQFVVKRCYANLALRVVPNLLSGRETVTWTFRVAISRALRPDPTTLTLGFAPTGFTVTISPFFSPSFLATGPRPIFLICRLAIK